MRKIFSFFVIIILSSAFLTSEDYNEFIENAISKNPSYMLSSIQNESNRILRLPAKYRWIPYPSFESSYNGNIFASDASPSQIHALKTGLTISQAIPGAVTLKGEAAQYFGFAKNIAESNQYEFSASLSASIPLFFVAPNTLQYAVKHELLNVKLNEDISELEFLQLRKNLRANLVSLVGSYLLLKKRISLEEKRDKLYKREAEADTKLWQLGRLSTFDLTERNTRRYEAYLSFVQMKQQYSNIVSELSLQAITEEEITASADSWISYWSAYVKNNVAENGFTDFISEKEYDRNFYNSAYSLLAAAPRLNFSLTTNPVSSSVGNASFGNAVKNYWTDFNYMQWQFSLGLTIPILPYSNEYHFAQIQKLNRSAYLLSKQRLEKLARLREENYNTNISMLEQLKEKAVLDALDEGNKMMSAQSSFDIGYLNELNFEYQKLNVLFAEYQVQEIQLRYIIALLSGY